MAFVTVLCGILLMLVTSAIVFSGRFRRDLLAGKDEAKVLGILNVKGATITVMLGILLGAVLWSASKSSWTLKQLSEVIPEEGPQLSASVGEQIESLRASHLSFVRLYYAGKKEEVEGFLRDSWIPEFMENVADVEDVRSDLAKALAEDSRDLGSVLSALNSAQQEQIAAQREALMRPLNEQEAQAIRHVEECYQDLLYANNKITALLRSLR
jgi:hypothetical protein